MSTKNNKAAPKPKRRPSRFGDKGQGLRFTKLPTENQEPPAKPKKGKS